MNNLTTQHEAPRTRDLRLVFGVHAFLLLFGFSFLCAPVTAEAAATLTQRASIFLSDSGGGVGSSTPYTGAATSTTLTSVPQGVRLNLRVQIDNTGDASSTAPWRVQWENNTDAPDVWNDLTASGTGMRFTYSEKGAIKARYGSVPLATSTQIIACSGGTTLQPGRFTAMNGTSTPMMLGISRCAELAYMIDTTGATLGKTYRFRVVNGSTTVAFSSYSNYPTLTMVSSMTNIAQITKEARGLYATSSLADVGSIHYEHAVEIGIDGNPVMVYQDSNLYDLVFAKCNDSACATRTVQYVDTGTIGYHLSLAIGSDGFPIMIYGDGTNQDLKFIKCHNLTCSSTTIRALDTAIGSITEGDAIVSLAVGSDGFPVMSYHDFAGSDLEFIKCNDLSCSSITQRTLDANAVTPHSSIAIDTNGYPVIAYGDSAADLVLMRCGTVTCSSTTSVTVDPNITLRYGLSMTMATDTNPMIAYHDFGTSFMKYARCYNPSCSSGATTTLDTVNFGGRDGLEIALDVEGFASIVYHEYSSDDLAFIRCQDASCSSRITRELASSPDTGWVASMAIGADGYPFIGHSNFDAVPNKTFKCSSLDCGSTASSSANITSTSSSLSIPLDGAGYSSASTSNNSYDTVLGATSTRIAYHMAITHPSNSGPIDVTWEGKLSVAASTYLQFWNRNTSSWQIVASNTSPVADTDFTLTYSTTSVSQYYSALNEIRARVVTATTTRSTLMSTDYFTGTLPNGPLYIAGTLYEDEGMTPIASSKNLAIAIGTSTVSLHATTSLTTTGAWNFTVPSGHTVDASTPILVWLDGYGTTTSGALFTKASSSNSVVSGLDIYQNRLIIRHEETSGVSVTLTDLAFYDGDNDSDIQYTSNSGALIVAPYQKLFVWPSKVFSASGTIEVRGNASSTSRTDGSMHLATSSTFITTGTTTLAGSFTASTSATYTHATSALVFNATTTGKIINHNALATLGTTTFSGAGGGWTFGTTSTTSNLTISTSTATVYTASNLTITGNLTNDGALRATAGTTTFAGATTQTVTGSSASSTFNHLTMSGAGDKRPDLPLTATGNFFVESGATFRASSTLTVGGHFTNNGTFVTAASSTSWVSRTVPVIAQWASITYGNGLFVAVPTYDGNSATTTLITSPDGITWTPRTAPIATQWASITYGNGLFVAVPTYDGNSATTTLITSPDGITWTPRTAPIATQWASITYGNGLFVAVPTYDDSYTATTTLITSPDGITWTARTMPVRAQWTSVTYGNGLFVAVPSLDINGVTTTLITSPDGVTWTPRAIPVTALWTSLTYGNGLFVGFAYSTGALLMTSPDGITWTTRSTPDANSWYGITYGNGLFVAITYIGSNRAAISPDGINWFSQTITDNFTSWTSVTYGNGLFVAVSNEYMGYDLVGTLAGGHPILMNGEVGQTFSGVLAGASVLPSLVMKGAGTKVLTGQASTSHIYVASTSGAVTAQGSLTVEGNIENRSTFSQISGTTTFISATQSATGSLTFSNLVIKSGTTRFSSSATTSNVLVETGGTFHFGPEFVVSGQYTNNGTSTFQGNEWESSPISVGGATSVTYGNGLFVAVFDFSSTSVFTSSDGVTWTRRTGPVAAAWASITYGNGLFVAVPISDENGATTTVITSPDGITWTKRTAPVPIYWGGITYGNGLFVAVPNTIDSFTATNTLMTSPDGITWTPHTVAEENEWNSVTYGNGLFVSVSWDGTNQVMTSPDGITWTARAEAEANGWKSVTYGKGLFVAVADSGTNRVMTSPDGITWTARTTPSETQWRFVTYGNGLFVAVGAAGFKNIMASPDGVIWSLRSHTADYLSAVTYGNGLFVAMPGETPIPTYRSSLWSTTTLNGTSAQTLSGTVSGGSSFGNVVMSGAGAKTFASNASTTNFIIESGSGAVTAPSSLTIGGDYANSGTFTAGSGTTTFSNDTPQTLSGTMTGTSSWNNVVFGGNATKTIASNASTTNLINGTSATTSTSTLVLPSHLTILGNFSQLDTMVAGSGTTTFGGTTLQTATGTMTGSSAFNNLEITNSSATTTFGAALTANGYTRIATPGTIVELIAGGTTTLATTTIAGDINASVKLRSTLPGTQSYLAIGGSYAISYLDVRDSGACGSVGGITFYSGTTTGNTTCWNYVNEASISSLANQTFAVGLATTSISQITIADQSTPTITSANDIRIKIATSSVRMLFDTTDTSATFGGTAGDKVLGTVSYEGGGSVLVIDVTSNFSANDTLTISGLSFSQFTATNTATVALGLYTDGASDTVANSTDDKTVTITGSFAVLNHTSGQVSDGFSQTSASDLEILRFKVTPAQETFTLSNLVVNLTGVDGIVTADLTNARLYQDTNSDGVYDASDTQRGGSPALSISGQSGTITWSTSFAATTTRDYVVVLDTANIKSGDFMTVSLTSSGITAIGDLTSGTAPYVSAVTSVQHVRGGGGSSGSHGSGGAIGGDAPAGQGQQSGGGSGGGGAIDTDTGGTSLGDSPGFEAPESHGSPQGSWTNGGNGYNSDGSYATETSTNDRHTYGSFGFSVPGSNTITGIEVKLESSATTPAGEIEVALSWNKASSFTSYKSTGTLTATDAIYTLGSPSDTWGRSWTPDETTLENFFIEVRAQPSGGNTVQIDAIRVRIYHQASGGGGGGGGMVFVPRENLPQQMLTMLTNLGVDLRRFRGWHFVRS